MTAAEIKFNPSCLQAVITRLRNAVLMKRVINNLFAAAIILLISICVVSAQTGQTKKSQSDVLASEVTALRQKLVEAIKKRDKNTLESLYADDFTHTHASGQVDDKSKRIAALISGDMTIESAEVNEINIRFYDKQTAIAIGQSTIKNKGETTEYRWTTVYVKPNKKWQIVASQATRLAAK